MSAYISEGELASVPRIAKIADWSCSDTGTRPIAKNPVSHSGIVDESRRSRKILLTLYSYISPLEFSRNMIWFSFNGFDPAFSLGFSVSYAHSLAISSYIGWSKGTTIEFWDACVSTWIGFISTVITAESSSCLNRSICPLLKFSFFTTVAKIVPSSPTASTRLIRASTKCPYSSSKTFVTAGKFAPFRSR